MENKALLWFKPNKIGWLLLRHGMLEEQRWKKLHCIIKGNNLFYIRKLNRPEPQGVLPLEGSIAEISHQNNDRPNIHCFVLIMKKSIIIEDQVQIRNSYLFASESIEDCQCWVGTDAINMSAIPTHIARLKLQFAKQEVDELLIRLTNLQKKDAQRLNDEDFKLLPKEEDPLVLQALANQLMELYHSMNLAEDSKAVARKQIYTTHRYIAKLQEAKIMFDEKVEEQMKPLIQNEMSKVNEILKYVTLLRCSLRDVAKEIEVFNGNHEYGPQVHVMATCKTVLQNTTIEIKKLQEQVPFGRKDKIPNEGELLELCNKVNAIYESERILLQKALPKENIEIVAQHGRHYFCSLASYALVPTLENHTKRKQDAYPISELDQPNTRWWFIKRLLNLFSNKKVLTDAQNNNALPNVSIEIKESENQINMRSKSNLLPHLQMEVKESIFSSSLLTNENREAYENNKYAENNKQKKNSLLSSTNGNHREANENEKDANSIKEQLDPLLSLTNEKHSKDEENKNDIKTIKEEIDSISNKDEDIFIMSIDKTN